MLNRVYNLIFPVQFLLAFFAALLTYWLLWEPTAAVPTLIKAIAAAAVLLTLFPVPDEDDFELLLAWSFMQLCAAALLAFPVTAALKEGDGIPLLFALALVGMNWPRWQSYGIAVGRVPEGKDPEDYL